ncbi:CitMHS family transporter [Marinivivus vitaminiproducens]|uniref:CitMHS family transporter n=1 Tax=Marinivivus vitaminiproducens TaxID=3035935 RepID=UPI00279C0A15|nr:citrate:proton symporter [Geminicoccaceae bacterium SCSIO 64248]
MLALLGFVTIAAFLVLTLYARVSVLVALVLVPLAAGLLGGFGGDLGPMMLDGLGKVAPTGIMIMFAVLYFGLMIGTGIFDPMIRMMVSLVRGDPVRLCLVTAALAMLVALDGDGATTFLISVTALLPVHRALGMNPLVLPGVIALSAGTMNLLPWGGPTARAMAVLEADASVIFTPVVPAMLAGLAWVFVASAWIGAGERRRLGVAGGFDPEQHLMPSTSEENAARPNLFWFNVGLTALLVLTLFLHLAPLPVLFIVGFVIALVVNYPSWEEQRERLVAHADSVVIVTSMIFAAGIFTGVLTGTGMIDAMARSLVQLVPDVLTPYLPQIVAIASMPLSLAFTPDAFYYGMLPVFAGTAEALGHDGAAIGRAAILGQMTTGFPLSPLTASTFILVGLSGVTLAAHQRFIFKWAFATTLVMTVVATVTGAI